MNRARRLVKPTSIHVILIIVTLVNLFPLYYMISTSFKGDIEVINNQLGLPSSLGIDNYQVLLVQKGFPRLFLNTVTVSVFSVSIALAISCLAAYALARLDFWGRQPILDIITAFMAIPPIVVIIPLFVLMSSVRLINQYPSAIIAYIGFILPFSVFILTGYFCSIPQELLDAGKIDGANELRLLIDIILPLSKAPLITLAIVNGLWVWNELLIALMFLQREEMRTLMVGIAYLYGRNARNIPLIMSGSVLASLPMLIILAFGQRYFVRGLTAGAVK